MNSDIETLAAISAGYRRGHDRLEELRIKEIRESDIVTAFSSFDQAFKSALMLATPRETRGLSKLERVLFGVDK